MAHGRKVAAPRRRGGEWSQLLTGEAFSNSR
jgi:hypothetical protein